MRQTLLRAALAGAALVCAGATIASAAGNAAVPQTVGPAVSQAVSVPALRLSEGQRSRIRAALSSKDTEVSFGLKSAKGAANFAPSLGAKVPGALKLHPLPGPLVYEMPSLKRYMYVKVKHEVLIVNPMTRKIVDLFPET